jgi:hypothetical protein
VPKIKYNMYSVFLVLISAGNLALLYLTFGMSDELKHIFIILNTFLILQIFIQMPAEQIIYVTSRAESSHGLKNYLFSNSIVLSVCLSIVVWVICFSAPSLLEFISGLKNLPRLNDKFGITVLIMLCCPTISFICQQYLNICKRIGQSFLLNFIPLIWQSILLLLTMQLGFDQYDYLLAFSLGYLTAAIGGIFLARHIFWGEAERDFHEFLELVNESFKFKLAHSIHNIGLNWMLNQCGASLSGFQTSALFGVKRFTEACQTVLINPLSKILPRAIGSLLINNRSSQVLAEIKTLQKVNIAIYFSCLLIGSIFILLLISLFSLELDYVSIIVMLAAYGIYSMFVCLDYPYSTIVSLARGHQVFFRTNLIFISILFCGYILSPLHHLFSFLLSIAAGQFVVLLLKKRNALGYLADNRVI